MKKPLKIVLIVIGSIAAVICLLDITGLVQFRADTKAFENPNDYKLTTDSPISLLESYTHRSKDTTTKIYFVNFWAKYCGPCLGELEDLNTLKHSYPNDSTIRFMSFTNNDSAGIDQVLRQRKINFEFEKYYDAKGLRSQLKKICIQQHVPVDTIDAVPCFFIINSRGKIWRFLGGSIAGHEKAVKSYIDSLKAL